MLGWLARAAGRRREQQKSQEAAGTGARREAEARTREERPECIKRWGRLARGSRRLRHIRRVWHHLGEHLKEIKRRGR